ncbi:hypothetical protein SAMN04488094_12343 [Tropicimonas isoalkanivorans]|uniref:Uncharacterized protein n=1 Tax=Tropicimonas isoalkanivorans TaxID=441112 RepID=A0A1I1QTD8_9RHOB|nr:hypothetical protein SAMN04488094_12343 [Tropicimonas isoalkanivorans]
MSRASHQMPRLAGLMSPCAIAFIVMLARTAGRVIGTVSAHAIGLGSRPPVGAKDAPGTDRRETFGWLRPEVAVSGAATATGLLYHDRRRVTLSSGIHRRSPSPSVYHISRTLGTERHNLAPEQIAACGRKLPQIGERVDGPVASRSRKRRTGCLHIAHQIRRNTIWRQEVAARDAHIGPPGGVKAAVAEITSTNRDGLSVTEGGRRCQT